MLVTIENLIGIPVMSLQTGTKLAETTAAIIDPRQLTIAAFYVEGPHLEQSPSILHPSDIRELGELGMIVDDADKLTSLDGLVRLQQVLDFGFELVGLKVVDERKHKLGKVTGYGVDTTSYNIMQVYTEQPLFRSLSSGGSTIHRSQIISVNNRQMVVQSPTIRAEEKSAKAEVAKAFVNPFRSNNPQPDSTNRSQT